MNISDLQGPLRTLTLERRGFLVMHTFQAAPPRLVSSTSRVWRGGACEERERLVEVKRPVRSEELFLSRLGNRSDQTGHHKGASVLYAKRGSQKA